MEKVEQITPEEAKEQVAKDQSIPPSESLVKKFPGKGKNITSILFPALGALLVVALGTGAGYLLSGGSFFRKSGSPSAQGAPGAKTNVNEAGIDDAESFPDEAEGTLEEGGIEGEGTYHLVRGSGPNQYAYLTSTVIDLGQFVGKKVQVKGQSIAADNAPWLMDVGYVKVVE